MDGRDFNTDVAKLLANPETLEEARRHEIRPLCFLLCPTEACDSDCSFCHTGGRPQKRFLPFRQIDQLLYDMRFLGAKSVILTGGGNPLLYKDRNTGHDISDVVRRTGELGYRVGIITNSESLEALHPSANAYVIDWVRISLIKLEEGFDPADYDLAGFPEERVSFSHVLPKDPPRPLAKAMVEMLKRFPRARFLRLTADYTALPEGQTERLRRALPLIAGRAVVHDPGGQEPFAHACYSGLYRPYVAAPPDGLGEYLVYACCWHVTPKRVYDRDYALCKVSEVRQAWPAMWERWATKGYPYEVRGNGGKDWDKTCTGFCQAAAQNRLLYDAAYPPRDSVFA